MRVRIGEAAKELGVSIDTLRRWEKAGRIEVERTPQGHRRYDLAQLRGLGMRQGQPETRVTLAYAGVSASDQKADLTRQAALLESYCAAQGWTYEVIQDLGSGLNYHKRGLKQLIRRVCRGEIRRLVLTHKDRLLRFGSELIFALCEQFGTTAVDVIAIRRAVERV